MGSMSGVFFADGMETDNRYSVSEWWLEPNSSGPGAHAHDEYEELFYTLEGVMTFQVGDKFVNAPRGSFIRIPPGMVHDFMNKCNERAGVLNIKIPGGFEKDIRGYVRWFEEDENQI